MSTITDGTTGSAESQQLRASIEAQRAMLGRDLEALGAHVSPGRVVEPRKRAMSTRMSRMGGRVMGAAAATTSALGERRVSLARPGAGVTGRRSGEGRRGKSVVRTV